MLVFGLGLLTGAVGAIALLGLMMTLDSRRLDDDWD